MKIKIHWFLKLCIVSLFSVLSLVGCFLFYVNSVWQLPAKQVPELYKVENGWSYYRLINDLVEQGAIDSVLPFKVLRWVNPEFKTLKAGLYRLPNNLDQRGLIEFIINAKPAEFKITFIEGSQWRDWWQQMQEHPYIVKTLTSKVDPQLIPFQQHNSVEGTLFPDTYVFYAGTTDIDIVQQAHQRMKTVLNNALTQHVEMLDSPARRGIELNEYQILTLASIIEKETAVVSEMPTISSVFYNRLKKNMRLQTDPTVIYGLGEQYKGDITRAHLKQKTRYNTYVIKGLPPTPIAMPGKAAIEAAIYPAQSDYYYFVANGLGGHTFSKNLAGHNRAVKEYLRQLKKKD